MRLLKQFLLPILLLSGMIPLTVHADEHPSIVESITADSVNIIVGPEELLERLQYHAPVQRQHKADSRAGFRVQIFADGNQSTARNAARARIRQVSSRFPMHRTYLDYKSPYWRARIGDFRSREEANDLASQIRRTFPAFSNEIRVVSDRISIFDTEQ